MSFVDVVPLGPGASGRGRSSASKRADGVEAVLRSRLGGFSEVGEVCNGNALATVGFTRLKRSAGKIIEHEGGGKGARLDAMNKINGSRIANNKRVGPIN